MMRAVLFSTWLVLAGCSTPYQDIGFSGGVEAQQMTADTYRIVARGNAYTSTTRIQDYTMLKAAETARTAGGTHFQVISAADASSVSTVVSPGQAHTSVVGNQVYTSYSPATAHNLFKPGQDTYIRVFSVQPGQRVPPGALSADEIIQFVGGRVKRA